MDPYGIAAIRGGNGKGGKVDIHGNFLRNPTKMSWFEKNNE